MSLPKSKLTIKSKSKPKSKNSKHNLSIILKYHKNPIIIHTIILENNNLPSPLQKICSEEKGILIYI